MQNSSLFYNFVIGKKKLRSIIYKCKGYLLSKILKEQCLSESNVGNSKQNDQFLFLILTFILLFLFQFFFLHNESTNIFKFNGIFQK